MPVTHRRATRTTNLLERLFVEDRRRLKIIPNGFGEKPVLQDPRRSRTSRRRALPRSRRPSARPRDKLPLVAQADEAELISRSPYELILRLGAAVLVGCAVGLDREVKGKPTGVRTLGLVALGAALAVMDSTDFATTANSYQPALIIMHWPSRGGRWT